MKSFLKMALILTVFFMLANAELRAQKVGSHMVLFSHRYKLSTSYQIKVENGKYQLLAHIPKGKYLYNIWSTHSTYEDAEFLHKRLRQQFKVGGNIFSLKCYVKRAARVKPGPNAKYSRIYTLHLREVFVKPKI